MGSIPNLSGNAAEGRNTYVPMTDFAGYCTGISVDPSKNRNAENARRDAGRLASFVVFSHTNITVARLEDDTDLDMKNGGSVRFRYGVWDERRNETLNPTRDADWYTHVLPYMKREHDLDWSNPADLGRMVNKFVVWKLIQFTRDYEVQYRDPESNVALWLTGAMEEDGVTPVYTDRDKDADGNELDKAMVPAYYSQLLPVEIQGLNVSETDATDAATALWNEHIGESRKTLSAASDEETSAFVQAALDNDIISQVASVKRAIQNNEWTP